MLFSLMAAAAMSFSTGEHSYEAVCREAVDWKGMGIHKVDTEYEIKTEGEAYMGRLELAIRKRHLDVRQSEDARTLCHMYLLGAAAQSKWVEERVASEQVKVAARGH